MGVCFSAASLPEFEEQGESQANRGVLNEPLRRSVSEPRRGISASDSKKNSRHRRNLSRSSVDDGAAGKRHGKSLQKSHSRGSVNKSHGNGEVSSVAEQGEDVSARRMSLKELQLATDNFSESRFLGEGSFGKVYTGSLKEQGVSAHGADVSTLKVAVKRLSPDSVQGYDEWLQEVILLDRLRHPHLVRLVGFCAEQGEALLAYELCHRGSLDRYMHSNKPEMQLSWELRLKVALGAAEGLCYLHEKNIIHRDFKPSNVLLDRDMTVKLTDFGMAKEGPQGGDTHVSTRVMGTMGYLDPAYMQTGKLTCKSDTYSFGVFLLELLSGRKSKNNCLVRWANPLLNPKLDVEQLTDPSLKGTYSKAAATKVAVLVRSCVNEDPDSRPDMKNIAEVLRRVVKGLELHEGLSAEGAEGAEGCQC